MTPPRSPWLLDLVFEGNSILRRRAEDVRDVRDPSIQQFIDDMFYTCEKNNGAGLAAPQVGIPLRLFVIHTRKTPTRPDVAEFGPMAFINPTFTVSKATCVMWEGCLSIPGIMGQVRRPEFVEARWINRDGQEQQQLLQGFPARVFLHENDHLDGRLYTDIVEPGTIIPTEEYLQRAAAGTL